MEFLRQLFLPSSTSSASGDGLRINAPVLPNRWKWFLAHRLEDFSPNLDRSASRIDCIFWLDQHNKLLASCLGYPEIYKDPSFIQRKAGIVARPVYLERCGGFYCNMDYLALRNQEPLLHKMNVTWDQDILSQGRTLQVVLGFEWGFARMPGHPLWNHCLTNIGKNSHGAKWGCAIYKTGPKMLGHCISSHYKDKEKEIVCLGLPEKVDGWRGLCDTMSIYSHSWGLSLKCWWVSTWGGWGP